MEKITEWITVNGVHVPLKEGESKESGIKRFLQTQQDEKNKERQLAKQQDETDRLNGKLPKNLYTDDIPAEEANKTSDVLRLGTHKRYTFKEGTSITKVNVFAGKGVSRPFRMAEKYANKYGGDAWEWQHCAGMATITRGDVTLEREVHWVQGPDGKIREAFIKVYKKGK